MNWQGIADGSQVIVMYMAMKHLPEIAEKLISAGRDPKEPVAIVSNATQANMRVLETNLTDAAHDAAQADMKPPSIICIGKVTLMRQCLDWMSQAQGFAPRDLDPLGVREQADSA